MTFIITDEAFFFIDTTLHNCFERYVINMKNMLPLNHLEGL